MERADLGAADHAEVGLEAIEEGKEDDAGFVVLRGRGEDVAGERDGGREQTVVEGNVAGVERGEGERCGGSDGVEDAEEGVGVGRTVAEDEAVVVEVVAGVHADVGGELGAHGDFEVGVEEGDFDAVDFGGVGADNAEAVLRGLGNGG